jgi:hypothetical protein
VCEGCIFAPHALTYDNINISSSIFVEQGLNAMSKVQSGTFAVVYELLNACAEDMDIAPLVENLWQSSPLDISSLWMTPQAAVSYVSQCNGSLTVSPTWTSWCGLQHVLRRSRILGWLSTRSP